uniref:Uncharacterized protein n=1 Tax=Peronospora matthiolae TaxID=2874970 RepID=A0AAV1UD28_9STRA
MGVPDGRQRKLSLSPCDGKELYCGLGSGFLEWGQGFVRQVDFPERACGSVWPEEIKVDAFGQKLAGTAQKYYHRRWKLGGLRFKPWSMQFKGRQAFNIKMTSAQSTKLLTTA